jgi:hypothetical protein
MPDVRQIAEYTKRGVMFAIGAFAGLFIAWRGFGFWWAVTSSKYASDFFSRLIGIVAFLVSSAAGLTGLMLVYLAVSSFRDAGEAASS